MNKKSKTEKPIDCIICTEKLGNENPLECGHYIHLECVRKHFKPECPLCRRILNVVVTGVPPEPYIPHMADARWRTITRVYTRAQTFVNPVDDHVYEHGYDDDSLPDLEDISVHRNSWKRRGYTHREEDDEYDEENPLGDDWDYEDV